MVLINLYGAPGSGKSTGAAYVFSKLKMNEVNGSIDGYDEIVKDVLERI